MVSSNAPMYILSRDQCRGIKEKSPVLAGDFPYRVANLKYNCAHLFALKIRRLQDRSGWTWGGDLSAFGRPGLGTLTMCRGSGKLEPRTVFLLDSLGEDPHTPNQVRRGVLTTQAQLLPGTFDLLVLRAISLGSLHGCGEPEGL
jgi:hypothetical protein